MHRDPKWRNMESFLESLPQRGIIAELGVYHGTKTRVVYDILRPKKMIWVDWWAKYYNADQPPAFWAAAKRDALRQFKHEIATKKITIHHCGFMTAVRRIADERLDFIRHDADERQGQVTQVLRNYWPKLKPGGIWMGHGFEDRPPFAGTLPAVVQHLRENPDAELLGVLWDQSHFCLRRACRKD